VDREPACLPERGLAHGGLAHSKRMAPLNLSVALRALRCEPTSRRRAIVVRRRLEAPVWQVFCIFAEPEHSMRGWAPRDFAVTAVENDFRPGGAYRVCLRSPEGSEHWILGTYREIVPFTRVVFTHRWRENGEPSPETLVTVTASGEGLGTRVTLEQAGLESERECTLHLGGWHESFDRIAAHLTSMGPALAQPCRSRGPPAQ
jgi:uncharacterized protein YndB with AHSA1/START domain